MKLVQILLPLRDNRGRPFKRSLHERLRQGITDEFGGLTAYARSPARGVWKSAGKAKRNDLVVLEIMSATHGAPGGSATEQTGAALPTGKAHHTDAGHGIGIDLAPVWTRKKEVQDERGRRSFCPCAWPSRDLILGRLAA